MAIFLKFFPILSDCHRGTSDLCPRSSEVFEISKFPLKATDICGVAQDSTLFRDLLKASWDDKASAKDLCSVAISLAKLRCLVCRQR